MTGDQARGSEPPDEQRPTLQEAQPEVVVMLAASADVAVRGGRIVPENAQSRRLLEALAQAAPDGAPTAEAEVCPLFAPSPDKASALAALAPAAAEQVISPLETYFNVTGVTGGQGELAERLRGLDFVAGAYVKPPAELPASINDMAPRAEEPPAVTPSFRYRQLYLDAAPVGVDAVWAHAQPGGKSAGVDIVDIEGAWRFTHEDLLQRQGGVIGGTPSSQLSWRNHGTAVVGVIGGDDNGIGVTGIAPEARQRAIAIFGPGAGSSPAIRQAADALATGDLLLIELHRPGPRAGLAGQFGYIPVEWWPDDFDAIVYAVARGVIVVEAAGNGSQDLDDPVYDTAQQGFPAGWSNPFRRSVRDSGAVVVGAGAPPPGTHGRDWGPDRSRLDFSNYGSMIDAQGWGREVATCGYGDLQGGAASEDYWYTDQFSGTSSASPIVTGALASVQGILRAGGGGLLTPATARRYLRETGSPQQPRPGAPASQRIGSRPDIRSLVARARAGKAGKDTKEGKESKEGKEGGEGGGKSFPKLEKNEFKDMIREKGAEGRPAPPPGDGGYGAEAALETRLRAVEAAVAELRHFIPAEQRPDLTGPAQAAATEAAGKAPGKAAKKAAGKKDSAATRRRGRRPQQDEGREG
jgi:Subtilase family